MTHHRTAVALADLRLSELRVDAERTRIGRSLRRTRRGRGASPKNPA